MTNEVIGILGVFVFTGILLLVRHLILTAGNRKRKSSLTQTAKAAKRGPRRVEDRTEKAGGRASADSRIWSNPPGTLPRFRV